MHTQLGRPQNSAEETFTDRYVSTLMTAWTLSRVLVEMHTQLGAVEETFTDAVFLISNCRYKCSSANCQVKTKM
jgi:hypothetical protein